MTRRTRTTQPNHAATPKAVADERVRRVHTLRAARVLSYTVDPPSADVQMVHREPKRETDGTTVAHPIAPLRDVPVEWSSGGGCGIVWGLDPGDPVYVAVREVDHDAWDAGQRSDDQTPAHDRRHQWSDAVVLPMDTLVGRSDGAMVVLVKSGTAGRWGGLTASEGPAMASAVREELDALWSALATHVHTVTTTVTGAVPAGASPVTGAGSAAAPGTVPDTRALASTRLLTDDTITPGVGVT